MNSNQKIAVVVFTAIFLLVTRVRRVLRGLAIKFNGVRIVSTTADYTAQLQINALLRNTLPFSVTVDSIDGLVYLNGVQAGTITQYTPITIHARAITPASLMLNVDFKAVGEGVQANIMSGAVQNLNIRIVGNMVVEGRKFNIDKVFSYGDFVK